MIQDDYGNLVDPTHARTLCERLEAGVRRMAAIETDLSENTRATHLNPFRTWKKSAETLPQSDS